MKNLLLNKHIYFISYKNILSSNNMFCYYRSETMKFCSVVEVLNKIKLNFIFINNLKFNFIEGCFFVIKLIDIDKLENIKNLNLYLFGFEIFGYFLNCNFFTNINAFKNFYKSNYIFILNILTYFINIFFKLILLFKNNLLIQVNLFTLYKKKNKIKN